MHGDHEQHGKGWPQQFMIGDIICKIAYPDEIGIILEEKIHGKNKFIRTYLVHWFHNETETHVLGFTISSI